MNDVIKLLQNIKHELNSSINAKNIPVAWNKLDLYVKRFFKNSKQYNRLLEEIITSDFDNQKDISESFVLLNALIDTLIEDANLNNQFKIEPIEQYNKRTEYIADAELLQQKYQERITELENIINENERDIRIDTERNKQLSLQLDQELSSSRLALQNCMSDVAEYKSKLLNTEVRLTELTSILDITKAKLHESQKKISELKEFKQKHEIAKNSLNFHRQAETNKKNANRWMTAVIISVFTFLIYLIHGLYSNEELYKVALNIIANEQLIFFSKNMSIESGFITKLVYVEVGKKIAAKILIYSMIIYFISFLVKNYNAEMHNFVTNSNKANALSSTIDLIGTAKQDDGNDKILAQATQAIFTGQRSGYQGADSEPKSPNLVTNIIETIGGMKKD